MPRSWPKREGYVPAYLLVIFHRSHYAVSNACRVHLYASGPGLRQQAPVPGKSCQIDSWLVFVIPTSGNGKPMNDDDCVPLMLRCSNLDIVIQCTPTASPPERPPAPLFRCSNRSRRRASLASLMVPTLSLSPSTRLWPTRCWRCRAQWMASCGGMRATLLRWVRVRVRVGVQWMASCSGTRATLLRWVRVRVRLVFNGWRHAAGRERLL